MNDIATRVMEFNRIKSFVSRYVLGQYWASALWRLHHIGEIDSYQKEAGDDWARIVFRHRKYNLSSEGSDEQAIRAVKEFNGAIEAMGSAAIVNAVTDLCVEDKHLEPHRLKAAKDGLSALVLHLYGSRAPAKCDNCGSIISKGKRGPLARFCGARCQKAAMRRMAKTSDKSDKPRTLALENG